MSARLDRDRLAEIAAQLVEWRRWLHKLDVSTATLAEIAFQLQAHAAAVEAENAALREVAKAGLAYRDADWHCYTPGMRGASSQIDAALAALPPGTLEGGV